jgi:outer membrane receptor protein involved in Fe transport
MRFGKSILMAGATTCLFVSCTQVAAEEARRETYDLPSQPLGEALRAVARANGQQLVADAKAIEGRRSPALSGAYTLEEAVRVLLRDTALTAEFSGQTVIIRGRARASDAQVTDAAEQGQIMVTGSRIRGAPPASPVTTLNAAQIVQAGQNDLGEAVRTLPQSFGGGQNPGVALGAPGSNNNQNSASSINLRGLGPDATLTLLNGHRLAYGSFTQAVDVTAIPLAAVDRIEIVADGASALYGSDAVGGVANIVLRKDYQGVSTTARLGAATDGGNAQQQYSVVAGTSWNGGGFIATYDFERDTAITASQRRYTDYMQGDDTLLPQQKRHSAVVSLHQDIAPMLAFSIDGVYNWRRTFTVLDVPGSFRSTTEPTNTSFSIAPTFTFEANSALTFTLSGVYGKDRTNTKQFNTSTSGVVTAYPYCYCNTVKSLELSSEGSAFSLPAGNIRFAAGIGYRDNGYLNRTTNLPHPINAHQDSYYAFGEVFAPLVSPAQSISGVYRLSVSGALRYEKYPGIDEVVTPKFGVIYAPTADFDVKASWGKSFKAPTLFQQYQPQYAFLYSPTTLGGTGYPANAAVLFTNGGNPALKPERATSWSATLAAHPRAVPGLKLEASYFHIDYRDRVTQPFQGTDFYTALLTTTLQKFIDPYPSPALQSEIIGRAPVALYNYAGVAYNPANVVAAVYNTYFNAARQKIQGVDLTAGYHVALAGGDTLDFNGSASWLDSKQRLDASIPYSALAGTIFNPPHWRARAGASWTRAALSVSAFGNYIGGVNDTRSAPAAKVKSQVTLDLSAVYRPGDEGLLRGVGYALSVRNLFNDRPAYARAVATYYVNYDSTNQSAVGRFASFSITKEW